MKVMKYFLPFLEVVEYDPHICKCINVKTSIDLLGPNDLALVCINFTHATQTSKSVNSRESRILSETSQ